ncbi:MAG TPA: DUF4118 domain-containing protein [Verrucomicrobiae bacterium]|jgi:two-component system sensor histidine kinase KdpD|nr:DUF4118 domain-containing protein [Verrucomicrobiae bacterium]
MTPPLATTAHGECLLVAVGPTPEAEAIIRWAHALAATLRCRWIALYVGSSAPLELPEEADLNHDLDLARDLGAETLTTTDEDVVRGLMRVASQWNVTQIIAGKPRSARRRFPLRRGDHVAARLLRQSGKMLIHLVGADPRPRQDARPNRNGRRDTPVGQYGMAAGVVGLMTGAAFLFTPVVGAHATALVFLLTVVLLALVVDRGPALVAAALSALLWDYFFLPPIFAFAIHSFEDAMLFGMYFVVVLALGQLTARIKAQQNAERQREAQATALYLLIRKLNEARTSAEVLSHATAQVEAVFRAPAKITLAHDLAEASAVVRWVIGRGRAAGHGSDKFAHLPALYVPLSSNSQTLGALCLDTGKTRILSLPERALLESFAQQIALALERWRLNELAERTRALTESERLSKTLLDSMSHELRTPIAAIQGATGNLLELGGASLSNFQRQMMEEIAEATSRLDRLVGNALELNRLEAGAVKPVRNECDPVELVHLCIAETEKRLARHRVSVALEPGLPVLPMDFVLTQHAFSNLLSNAAAHTPPGTAVEVSARVAGEFLVLTVADRGPGLEPDLLPRIFDKFVRSPNAAAGGTGLGLSLVKGFIEAQDGTVVAANRPGGGALFAISLPLARAERVPEPALAEAGGCA